MTQPGEPYRGADRRRVSRGADESLGWVVAATVALVVAATLVVVAVAGGLAVPAALASDTAVALLRAAGTIGTLSISALVLKQARLTGEAAPRLVGAAVLLLAVVVAVAELPGALGAGPAELLLTLRAAGLLTAGGLLGLGRWWSTIDAGLRTRRIVLVAVLAFAALVAVLSIVLSTASAEAVRPGLSALVTAALAGLAGALLWRGWRVRRRLLLLAGLLAVAWLVAQLPLVAGLSGLDDVAVVLDGLRLAAVAVGTLVALDDLEAAFVAQRHALLRTELDRQTVEARLQAHREQDQERAHEARSALTAIEGASTMLARYQAVLDDDGRVSLSSAIQAEIRRLQHLVDATRPPEPEPLPLGELVDAEASLSRQQGATVHVDVPADVWVLAEHDGVIGVLRNLLVNARTHAPEATVWITGVRDGADVELRVRDDGPGLSGDDLDHAFDRGHRGQGAERRPGSGLGLHVARELAERDGGSLTVESEPGQGATFVLRLPQAAAAGEAPSAGERGGARPRR